MLGRTKNNNQSVGCLWYLSLQLLLFTLIFITSIIVNTTSVSAADAGTKTNPISVSETSYSSVVTQVRNAQHASLLRQRVFVKKSPASTDLDIVAQNVINEANLVTDQLYSFDVYHTPLTKYTIGQEDGVWYIDFKMLHPNTAEQNALAQDNITAIVTSLSFSGKTQYQKIKLIYDYTIANMAIDLTYKDSVIDAVNDGKVNLEQIPYFIQYMILKANNRARVITGNIIDIDGIPHRHSWIIVKIGSYWYNLDPAPYMVSQISDDPATCYRYFLKSNDDFPYHERDAEFNTEEFNTTYNMTPKSYDAGSTRPKPGETTPTCIYPEIKKF